MEELYQEYHGFPTLKSKTFSTGSGESADSNCIKCTRKHFPNEWNEGQDSRLSQVPIEVHTQCILLYHEE